jgi:outer membrane lipoprotein-sorting protein
MTTAFSKIASAALLAAALVSPAGAVWPYDRPADLTAEELLSKVSARYDAATDFSASLTVVTSSPLGESLTQAGTLWARQPNLFRIEYQEPSVQTVIFDGRYMYVVNANADQVIRYEGGGMAELFNLPRALDNLKPDYDMELASETLGTYELHLKAKTDRAYFPVIYLWVAKEGTVLKRADLRDSAGNLTSYRFDGYRFDVGVAAGRFTYRAPAGVEVVDGGGALGP